MSISVRIFLFAFFLSASSKAGTPPDPRGGQFIGFNHFSAFDKQPGSRRLETVLVSPVIVARIPWDELVVSWNAQLPEGTYLKVEARAIFANGPSAYYTMGLWSGQPKKFPRESVPGQEDANGKVSTDTLVLKRPAERVQVRLTMGSESRLAAKLTFLGLCLTDTKAPSGRREQDSLLQFAPGQKSYPLPPNREAWGIVLPVPEKSQMSYPNGNVLCSPTTVSMLLAYWAERLSRPELLKDVPEIAEAIYDAKWQGTGNWVFNTAYAGSFKGIRAYVTRLSDVSELEDWISKGIPVGLSLCYDRLRGKAPKTAGNGHLVVCVGFTESGDVVLNDPGTSQNVRKIFPRRNLIDAWSYSKNTVYLVYPNDVEIPKDRFGHWASWSAWQRVRFE